MKKISLFLTFTLVFLLVGPLPFFAFSSTPQIITLKDGTTIQGKIISFSEGVYTVQSPYVGTLRIKEDSILSINRNIMAQQEPTPQQLRQEINETQKKLLQNPSLMKDIVNLGQDPQVIQTLSDPQIKKQILQQDWENLKNNPKIKQLMNHPKVREIINKASQ